MGVTFGNFPGGLRPPDPPRDFSRFAPRTPGGRPPTPKKCPEIDPRSIPRSTQNLVSGNQPGPGYQTRIPV